MISSGDMYLLFGASILSFCNSLECNSIDCSSVGDFAKTLAILPAILWTIKSPVVYAVFRIALFKVVSIPSIADFLAISKSFWPYLLLKYLPMFFYKNDKNPYPFPCILSLGSTEYLIFIIDVSFNYLS